MKTPSSTLKTKITCLTSAALLLTSLAGARADGIFVDLLTGTGTPGTTSISPPSGFSYSAAAPVLGNTWNTVGKSSQVPINTTPLSSLNLYSGLSLVNSEGAATPLTLSVDYWSQVTTGTRTQPSNVAGENTIQLGGPNQQIWRNYYNGSGNYFTFTISGLMPSTPVDLYILGGTTTSGQGVGVTLASANGGGTATGANTTQNSLLSYGSLWTDPQADGSYELMPSGTTWDLVSGTADSSGNFAFLFNRPAGLAYLGGFQLVVAIPEPASGVLLLGGLGFLWALRRSRVN